MNPCPLHGHARRGGGHGRVVLVRPGDVTFADSGPLDDPLVVGVQPHRRELVVVEDAVGRTPADAGEVHEGSFHALAPGLVDSPRRSPMCASRRDAAARAATFTAFLSARADDFPCAMMLMPLTPRSGAPPYVE